MAGRKKAVKKELLDKLEKKSSKKIIPPDEKPHWWFKPGNKVGLKWTDEKIQELCAEIDRLSKTEFSVIGIVAELQIQEANLYDLAKRYKKVAEFLDLAKKRIARKAWKHGFESLGFPNILQMAIRRHDPLLSKEEKKDEYDQLRKIEKMKTDEKIRAAKELGEAVEKGDMLTPAQALMISKMVDAEVEKRLHIGD
tara:strand:- start:20238 stop:20825 length:588 start_codon:yes stop_codon:yes gene_type:complete